MHRLTNKYRTKNIDRIGKIAMMYANAYLMKNRSTYTIYSEVFCLLPPSHVGK